jgi:ATP-binding cassette subfamily B protein
LAALAAVGLPVALQPFLAERELRMRGHGAALARLQLDSLLGLLAVRSHGAERTVRHQYEAVLAAWREAGLAQLRGATAATVAQSLAGHAAAVALVLGHVGRHGVDGSVILLAYWALKLPELGAAVAAGLQQLPLYRAVAVRLLEPLGAPEEDGALPVPAGAPQTGPGVPGVAVRFEGVAVAVAGRRVLEDLELAIGAGQRIAVLGPSGAGKSTLVGLLLGWHRPAAGGVWIDGQPLDGPALERLRAATAWIDPQVRLWNRPLLDNLRYGATGVPPSLARVIPAAGLEGVMAGLPEGLTSRLGEAGGLLSGGEGQRVRLGRALARAGARLVILDEPFRGLDGEQRRRLLATTRAWWPAATLLCVTHDAALTRDFDQVVILEGGRVVEAGAPPALAEREGSRYRALLDAGTAPWAAAFRREHLEAGRVVAARGREGAP